MIQKINALASKYREETAKNLSDLIQKKSLSQEEKDVQELLMKQFKEAGVDEVRMDKLGNVIARIGNGPKVLAFDAHMDTVDLGVIEHWNFEPLGGMIKNGFVHGRGTVDQKGGAASFITSARIVRELDLANELTIYFIGSVMEEDCDGLCWKYLVEEEKIKPDFVVSTEPTDMNLYRGHRGRMEMQVSFYGRSSHGSAPERGINAIYMASEVALKIKELNNRLKTDTFLGKGSVTISEIISQSPSLCAVSDYARIHLDRRLTWGETKESAVKEIEELIQGMDAKVEVPYYEETSFTGLKYGMEKYFPTWKMEEAHPFVQKGAECYEAILGFQPKIDKWTFSTNGVTINGYYGIPLIGLGPGEEALAHSPNEKVAIDDLEKASAFYAGLCWFMGKD